MKKLTKTTIFAFLLLALLPFVACAAEGVATLSDPELASGDWTTMAQRYPNPHLPGEIPSAPSPDILASWWDSLGDETLTELIALSLKNNKNLQVARARVTESRATLGINKAAILPWLDSASSWNRSKTPVNSTGDGVPHEIYRRGIDASWEIDLFGGQRENIKAGAASLEAQYADLHAAWVSLSSEVALHYLSLRTLQERLAVAQKNLALQGETLALLQSRYKAGLTDVLALSQARQTMEQTRSMIPPIQVSIEETLNALAILIGTVPGSLEETLGQKESLPKPDAVNLVGIPADYLRQRPDIRAAERRLVAQIARKKSAKADLRPKFFLIGSIGLESLSSGNLFSSDSYRYSFGPRISWPIFHGGAIRNNIRVQTAREEQLLAAYEQTVLSAVAEVRNALTSNARERERNVALKRGLEAVQISLKVANDKYKSGLTSFNNVIDAQRSLLAMEEQHAISEGQMTSNIVRLFKALGGGWEPLVAENQEGKDSKKQ